MTFGGREPGGKKPSRQRTASDTARRPAEATGKIDKDGPDARTGGRGTTTGLAGTLMILPQVHLRKPCYDFYFL